MKELLTGKCKEDFEKWIYGMPSIYDEFYADLEVMPLCFKYGVYLEFFMQIDFENFKNNNRTTFYNDITDYVIDTVPVTIEELQEVQTQALIKANSIYNERH